MSERLANMPYIKLDTGWRGWVYPEYKNPKIGDRVTIEADEGSFSTRSGLIVAMLPNPVIKKEPNE